MIQFIKWTMILLNLLLSVICGVYCKSLILHEYRQKTSKCTNGLISDLEYADFPSTIDNLASDPSLVIRFLERKTTTETFNEVFECLLSSENNSLCIARNKSETKQYFVFQVPALLYLSRSRVVAKMTLSKTEEIQSDEQMFPFVGDHMNTSGNININGQDIAQNDCFKTVNETKITILFSCKSQLLPCVITISEDYTNKSVLGHDFALLQIDYNNKNGREIHVNVKYCACNYTCKHLTCLVQIDLTVPVKIVEKYGDLSFVSNIFSLVLSVLLTSLIMLCWFFKRRKLCCFKDQELGKQSPQRLNIE
ncbi:unnamed protein product [Lymnaea stagnalis]|uniref:Uncharacterized protein n=1 Tax=Lymnaea stagnalis TaxID=6523 RepID=A0AAV2HNG7_LYMST